MKQKARITTREVTREKMTAEVMEELVNWGVGVVSGGVRGCRGEIHTSLEKGEEMRLVKASELLVVAVASPFCGLRGKSEWAMLPRSPRRVKCVHAEEEKRKRNAFEVEGQRRQSDEVKRLVVHGPLTRRGRWMRKSSSGKDMSREMEVALAVR